MNSFYRLLLADFKRAFISKNFLLATLLVVFFYILGTLDTFAECIKYGSEITTYDMHSMAVFSTFSIINYVLCAVPYAGSFSSDYKSNYYRSVVIRSGKRSYAVSKVIVTAVTGMLCLIVGESLYLIITSFFGPPVNDLMLVELNIESTEAFTTIPNADMLVGGNYLGYFTLLVFTRSLIGSFLSLIALWVSVKIQNIFVVISSPMLIYYFIENFSMNFLKLPEMFSIANIFEGHIAVVDSRYMFWYSLLVAVVLSVLIGFFTARGIERKISNE